MTEEEVYNTLEFKLIRKILKKEFKWVKDVRLSGDPNRYNLTVFLELVIDPWEMAEEEGLHPAIYLKKGKQESFMSIATFFIETRDNPIIVALTKEIENVPRQVHSTPSLPDEYKLRGKIFDISSYSTE